MPTMWCNKDPGEHPASSTSSADTSVGSKSGYLTSDHLFHGETCSSLASSGSLTPNYFEDKFLDYIFLTIFPNKDPLNSIIAHVLQDNQLTVDQFVVYSCWEDLQQMLICATKADLDIKMQELEVAKRSLCGWSYPNIHELEVGDPFPISNIAPALALLQSLLFFL
jgi:hypothetical protein